MAAGKFKIHDFVVMPDHIHLLLTVHGQATIEKAMQLIKGRFSIGSNANTAMWGKSGKWDFPSHAPMMR